MDPNTINSNYASIARTSSNPVATTNETYDLIVIGGGIYGTFLALEATQHGLRPLLIDRGQFGQATSKNSLRIIHGGLRYLQHLDLRRFGESLREQAWFFRNLPEHVAVLSCLMPLYNRGLRSRSVLRIALAVNDYLARFQDDGIRASRQLPESALLSRNDTVRLFPDVDVDGLCGGAYWCDLTMRDPQQLLNELLRRASENGTCCLNYLEATRLMTVEQQVVGLEVTNHKTGRCLQFCAPVVVNCAGPWCRELARKFDRDVPSLFHASLAFNLLLDRTPLSSCGIAVTPKRPRASTYFLLPIDNRILAGTYHQAWEHPLTDPRPARDQIRAFLHDLNLSVPRFHLSEDDVLDVYAGFLPARAAGSRHQTSRAIIYDHGAAEGPHGLYSVSGVKYTTARAVAETVIRKVGAGKSARGRTSRCS